MALGLALSLQNRYGEAEQEFETAIRLNPRLYDAYYFFARTCRAQGKMDEAVRWFQKAADSNPDDYQAPQLLWNTLQHSGDPTQVQAAYELAIQVTERHLKLYPDDARALCLVATALGWAGERERSLQWLARAQSQQPDEPRVLYNVACAYAQLDEPNAALDALEASVDAGRRGKEWPLNDPDFTPLHNHPRFRALIERM